MAKTLMREATRESILEWMMKEYDAKHDGVLKKPYEKAAAAANKAIRAKYPEADMVVLRKYNLAGRDGCLRFVNQDTGQVFGVEFYPNYGESALGVTKEFLADMPKGRGCGSSEVFSVNATQQAALQQFIAEKDSVKEARKQKVSDYKSFLAACKTVDEFNDAVPLPEDLRNRYMSGGALIAISPEKIAEISKDFKRKR
jgi:hypothetical protein